MKISDWLNKTFGGNWYLSNANFWLDSENFDRQATLDRDVLRVVERRELKPQ